MNKTEIWRFERAKMMLLMLSAVLVMGWFWVFKQRAIIEKESALKTGNQPNPLPASTQPPHKAGEPENGPVKVWA